MNYGNASDALRSVFTVMGLTGAVTAGKVHPIRIGPPRASSVLYSHLPPVLSLFPIKSPLPSFSVELRRRIGVEARTPVGTEAVYLSVLLSVRSFLRLLLC